MSRFVALVAPEVCASALRQAWPEDAMDQVRCLDAGSRALGLQLACAPWLRGAEDSALAAELDLEVAAAASFEAADEVAGWLAATPAAPPVLAMISGPMSWSSRVSDHEDALDIASDLAAERVRILSGTGVERLVVLEVVDPDVAADRAREAHQPLLRAGAHLDVDILLVAEGDAAAVAELGYERWVGPAGGSDGLAYIAPEDLQPDAGEALAARLDSLGGAHEIVTGFLDAQTAPEAIREAASRLSVSPGVG